MKISALALGGIAFLASLAGAQQSSQPQAQVPDAPSATRPNPFPATTKPAPIEQPDRPAAEVPKNEPTPEQPASIVPPPPDQEGIYKIPVSVNLVALPVTVKDSEGKPVFGLLKDDFTVLEDGQPQKVSFFTSDPFPLSAAVVIDQGMSDTAMRKINASLDSIAASFAPYDEVALYTYSNIVNVRADWQGVGDAFSAALKKAKSSGRTGGVPAVGGPMNSGPTVNGRPFDPGQTHVNTPVKESHVLNDAILQAAKDLSKRDPRRRKIIYLISDGREDGSTASYTDVVKLLLTYNIAVYALGVDQAAVPVYEKLARARIPRFGTGNILPKYVSATGGQLMTEFTREAIEKAYADLAGQARNQYTLAYSAKPATAPTYRSIEVLVKRPNLRVYARDGYYPLPPRR